MSSGTSAEAQKFEAVGNLIRECRGADGRGGHMVADVVMQRDDAHDLARLFAAAPALLDAAQLAEDVLARHPYSASIWPNGTHPNTGITKIRKAIAAAGGKPLDEDACADDAAEIERLRADARRYRMLIGGQWSLDQIADCVEVKFFFPMCAPWMPAPSNEELGSLIDAAIAAAEAQQ